MDQETDAGDHGQHGQRETVQHQVEANIEVAHRHPGPQRNADRLFAVGKEVDANKRRRQRRQTDRTHPHGGG